MAERLSARGWQPAVVVPGPGPLVDRLTATGIAVYVLPGAPQYSLSLELGPRKLPNPLAW